MEAPFTQEEIEEKSAEFVIKLVQSLEENYPKVLKDLIQGIQDGVY